MTSIQVMTHPEKVYIDLISLIVRLAENGLIHGDFNEFNLMIDDDEKITLIDFPQMVSTDHQRAVEFFNRDIQCIWSYFEKKYQLIHEVVPRLETDIEWIADLDKEMRASGFMKENLKNLDELDAIEPPSLDGEEAKEEIEGEGEEEAEEVDEGNQEDEN